MSLKLLIHAKASLGRLFNNINNNQRRADYSVSLCLVLGSQIFSNASVLLVNLSCSTVFYLFIFLFGFTCYKAIKFF